MNIPVFPADKANHWVDGGLVFLVVFAIAIWQPMPISVMFAWAIAAGVVTVAALGKEASDWVINWRKRAAGEVPTHGVELYDALATIAGGAVPAAAVLLTRYLP